MKTGTLIKNILQFKNMKSLNNTIRKIIKENIDTAGNFETKITKGVYIRGLEKFFDIEKSDLDYDCDFSILWSLDIESRSWGLKSIIPNVSSIRGTIKWRVIKDLLEKEVYDFIKSKSNYEDEDYLEGEMEFNSLNKFEGKEWIILDEDFKIKDSGELFPSEIDIDFYKMEITIS
jgi:hypothetical protein